jgi:hypothetical protein
MTTIVAAGHEPIQTVVDAAASPAYLSAGLFVELSGSVMACVFR